jgi:hypothetical protein
MIHDHYLDDKKIYVSEKTSSWMTSICLYLPLIIQKINENYANIAFTFGQLAATQ